MSNNLVNRVFSWLSHSTSLLFLAIAIGSVIGILSPAVGQKSSEFTDPTILVLVTLLLIDIPIKGFLRGLSDIRFISIAWGINFVLIPSIGFVIASLFLSGQTLFFTGLIIYFMAPCTDWYLGFTKMAQGNVELGAVLLPINMLSQLLLFPICLYFFGTAISYDVDFSMVIEWFVQPLLIAIILRLVFHRLMEPLLSVCRLSIPLVLALLVGQIFASNINVLMGHIHVVPILLLAIFVFFIITYLVSDIIARITKFEYPEHCLLSFTTGARNAPLMLGLTTVAIPDQPLIYATITIGMLIEFPHLVTLKIILLKRLHGKNMKPELSYFS